MNTKLALATLLFSATSQAGYWQNDYTNSYNHFYDSASYDLQSWLIEPSDQYITGNFFFSSDANLLGIKPGYKNIMMKHNTNGSPAWFALSTFAGTTTLGGQWTTRHNDQYVSGDFTGDGRDELLASNPNGNYQTLKGSFGSSAWVSLQSASNGNVHAGDKLIAGDFNGDNIEEVMLIKANGSHHTMSFNQQTANWDILSSGNTGSIYWWHINTSSDQYVAGDFDGDGKDELLALNPNGWHHTMRYDNNQWQYIEGGDPSNPTIAYWNIGSATSQYFAADFDKDGKDELLALNANNGWSHTIEMISNTQYPYWKHLRGNAGNGTFSNNWAMRPTDVYRVFEKYPKTQMITLNPDGHVNLLRY
jgi:hypothetical protein